MKIEKACYFLIEATKLISKAGSGLRQVPLCIQQTNTPPKANKTEKTLIVFCRNLARIVFLWLLMSMLVAKTVWADQNLAPNLTEHTKPIMGRGKQSSLSFNRELLPAASGISSVSQPVSMLAKKTSANLFTDTLLNRSNDSTKFMRSIKNNTEQPPKKADEIYFSDPHLHFIAFLLELLATQFVTGAAQKVGGYLMDTSGLLPPSTDSIKLDTLIALDNKIYSLQIDTLKRLDEIKSLISNNSIKDKVIGYIAKIQSATDYLNSKAFQTQYHEVAHSDYNPPQGDRYFGISVLKEMYNQLFAKCESSESCRVENIGDIASLVENYIRPHIERENISNDNVVEIQKTLMTLNSALRGMLPQPIEKIGLQEALAEPNTTLNLVNPLSVVNLSYFGLSTAYFNTFSKAVLLSQVLVYLKYHDRSFSDLDLSLLFSNNPNNPKTYDDAVKMLERTLSDEARSFEKTAESLSIDQSFLTSLRNNSLQLDPKFIKDNTCIYSVYTADGPMKAKCLPRPYSEYTEKSKIPSKQDYSAVIDLTHIPQKLIETGDNNDSYLYDKTVSVYLAPEQKRAEFTVHKNYDFNHTILDSNGLFKMNEDPIVSFKCMDSGVAWIDSWEDASLKQVSYFDPLEKKNNATLSIAQQLEYSRWSGNINCANKTTHNCDLDARLLLSTPYTNHLVLFEITGSQYVHFFSTKVDFAINARTVVNDKFALPPRVLQEGDFGNYTTFVQPFSDGSMIVVTADAMTTHLSAKYTSVEPRRLYMPNDPVPYLVGGKMMQEKTLDPTTIKLRSCETQKSECSMEIKTVNRRWGGFSLTLNKDEIVKKYKATHIINIGFNGTELELV